MCEKFPKRFMTEAREIGLRIRFRQGVAAGGHHRPCDENALRGSQKLYQVDRCGCATRGEPRAQT